MSQPAFHLDYQQIESVVDGRADPIEREIVQEHLEDCPPCRQLHDELVRLRQQVADYAAPAPSRTPAKRPIQRFWPWTPLLAGGIVVAALVTRRESPPPAPTPTPRQVVQSPQTPPPRPRPTPVASPLARHVQLAIASGRLPLPDLRALQTPPVRVRGPRSAPLPLIEGLRPAATRVRSRRPTFTWRAVPGASQYAIVVADEDDRPVAEAQGVRARRWRPARPLPRGRTLLWEVHAFDAAGQEIAAAPNVRFAVLSDPQTVAFERDSKDIASPSLEFAVACARHGLREVARQTLERLQARAPSTTIARLLESLR